MASEAKELTEELTKHPSSDEGISGVNGSLMAGDDEPHRRPNLPRKPSIIKDNTRKNARKKTVSFSTFPEDKPISKVSDCIAIMQAGSELIKLRAPSRQFHRIFLLSEDHREIKWRPSSKKAERARVLVENIKEVRLGKNTETFRICDSSSISFPEDCSFSIIYGDNYDSLDLVASTPDEANIWVTGLAYLTGSNRTPEAVEKNQDMRDRWLQEMFEKAAGTSIGQLDEGKVMELVKKLNNGVASVRVRQRFKEMTISKKNSGETRPTLSSIEFLDLFKEMSTRPEIYFLLVRYASDEYMTCDDLIIFLEAEQGMTGVTPERCLQLIQKFEPSEEGKTKGHLGIDGFTKYLISQECDLFDPKHHKVCQDMDHPLSHYYIASSHNTYLIEDQLKGPSSVEAYISALQKGCRWVELDCWDGTNNEPVIYHGHTFTSKILFKDVITAINQHAFQTSAYPVIVSFENHCSIQQQEIMAQYLTTILGDKIYVDPPESSLEYLPSPTQLRYKVLLKGKKLADDFEGEVGEVTDEDEGQDVDKRRISPKDTLKKHNLIKPLSDLVTLCKSIRFQSFPEAASNQKFWELCSFSEAQSQRLMNNFPEDFVNYNKKFLSRVYPNRNRVDSSNYNPQDLWNCGSQIVALNYQTPGLMTDLYDGKFKLNAGCGYIFKPQVMREEMSYFSAHSSDIIPGVSPQILHIKIISGQQFPKPRGSEAKGNVIDPYISMEVFGIPADCAEERTKTVAHNGNHPIFDESFEFTVNLPEQALVRFVVLDDEYIGDEFIGQYTIPFECMQPGYRHFTLLSNTGESLAPATLFVHVAITNKRGGGKPSKRGMSVRRLKNHKGGVRLRTIGVKSIDETFKIAVQPFRESFELRDKIQSDIRLFKESCGLAMIANLKQCVRVLASRAGAASEPVKLKLHWKGEIVILELEGGTSEIIKKSILAFEIFAVNCCTLIKESYPLQESIEEVHNSAMDYYETLSNLLQKEGLKGKKLAKATEGFAWNVRVLKGQMDILSHSRKECHEWMIQVYDAGTALGLTEEARNRSSQEVPVEYSDNEDSESSREQVPEDTPTATEDMPTTTEDTPTTTEGTPTITEDTPTTTKDTPTITDDTPTTTKDTPTITDDTPTITEDTLAITEDTPTVTEDTPTTTEDTPTITEDSLAIIEDTPTITEDVPNISEDTPTNIIIPVINSNHVRRIESTTSTISSDTSRKSSSVFDSDDAVFLETVLEDDVIKSLAGEKQEGKQEEKVSCQSPPIVTSSEGVDQLKGKVNNNLDAIDQQTLEARLASADYSTDI